MILEIVRSFIKILNFFLLVLCLFACEVSNQTSDISNVGVIMSGFPASVKLGEEFTAKITFENPEEVEYSVKYTFSFNMDFVNFDNSTDDLGYLDSDICGMFVKLGEYNEAIIPFSEKKRSYTSTEKFVSNIGGSATWTVVVSFKDVTKTFSKTVNVISNYKPQSFVAFNDLGNKQAQIDYSLCSADNKENVYDDYISKIESKIVSEFSEDTLCFVYDFEENSPADDFVKIYDLPHYGKYDIYVKCYDKFGNDGAVKKITESLAAPSPNIAYAIKVDGQSMQEIDCILPCDVEIDLTGSASQRENIGLVYFVDGVQVVDGKYSTRLTEENYKDFEKFVLRVKDDVLDGASSEISVNVNCRTANAPEIDVVAKNLSHYYKPVIADGGSADLGDSIEFSCSVLFDETTQQKLRWSYYDGSFPVFVDENKFTYICSDDGEQTINLYVEDSKGNFTTKTFIFNVQAHQLDVKTKYNSTYERMRTEVEFVNEQTRTYGSLVYYSGSTANGWETQKYIDLSVNPYDFYIYRYDALAKVNVANIKFKLKGVEPVDPIKHNPIYVTYKLCKTSNSSTRISESTYEVLQTKTTSGENWDECSFVVEKTSTPYWVENQKGSGWLLEPESDEFYVVIAEVYCEKYKDYIYSTKYLTNLNNRDEEIAEVGGNWGIFVTHSLKYLNENDNSGRK